MDRVTPEEAARGVLPSEVGRQSSSNRGQQSGNSSSIRDPRETGGPTHTPEGWPLKYFGDGGGAGADGHQPATGDRRQSDRTTQRPDQRDRTGRLPDDRQMGDRQFSEGGASSIRDPRETGGPTHTPEGWPLKYFGDRGGAGAEGDQPSTGDRRQSDRTTQRPDQRDRAGRFSDDPRMSDRQFQDGDAGASSIRDPRETGGPTHTPEGWPLKYFGSGGNTDSSQLPERGSAEEAARIRAMLGRGTGRAGSTPLDGNNNGVRDSIENYVPDPNVPATRPRDTLDARDWNANTDIDLPQTIGPDGRTNPSDFGFDEANLDPELDPNFSTQDVFPGDEANADPSDRFFGQGQGTGAATGGLGGAQLDGNRNTDAVNDGTVPDERFEPRPRPRPTTAGTDSGRDSRMLPQRRTARRPTDMDPAANRGLDRAADRLDRNAARITERFQNRSTRPTERAADRLESNADRFRQRTTEDE